ncbi:MAG: NAD(+) synthase [Cytophagales bacterium]|nr:NAD(+) synthase [Cytophagales bacterium]
MARVKIAGAALNQTPFDWKGNVKNILEAVREAKALGVEVLCLPELTITGYGCEDMFLADWFNRKAMSFLPEIAEACEGITVAVGVPVPFRGRLYNCACIIKDREILGFSAKRILASDGVHYEPRWFTPWYEDKKNFIEFEGKTYPIGSVIYNIDGLKMGIEICEDAWHPQRPALDMSEKGVDLVLNLSASHFSFAKTDQRYDLVVPPSKRFNCAYVYTNLLGNESGRIVYDGEVLISQRGELLQRNTRFSFRDINLVTAVIDTDRAQKDLKNEALNKDVRDKEMEFANAAALALFDYMRKARSRGFVLSLSGGADSSACAVLVAHMVRMGVKQLGAEAFLKKGNLQYMAEEVLAQPEEEHIRAIMKRLLVTVYQGTKNSGEATLQSARELAESLGASFYHWSVDEELDSYTEKVEQAIGRKLTWENDDLALQNIQARTRGPVAWMLANITGGLLLTTSNRSEGDVGYATMDGDTCGSIAPIAGVDKHFVLSWLRWAEKSLDFEGLRFVNSLQPTAELRPAEYEQTDESDLMPYPVIVAIERLAVGQRMSPVEVYDKLMQERLESPDLLKVHIIKFFTMWSRNQWKRERLAPSFHLDDFNIDPRSWCRFPILSGGFKDELEDLKKR